MTDVNGNPTYRALWMLWLIRNVDAPVTTKLFALTIATLADDQGTARVGVSSLAQMVGVSGLVARDHCRTLADMGLISRRWSTDLNRYEFVLTGVDRTEDTEEN